MVSWEGQVVKLSEYPRNCWRDLPLKNKHRKTEETLKEMEVIQRILPPSKGLSVTAELVSVFCLFLYSLKCCLSYPIITHLKR